MDRPSTSDRRAAARPALAERQPRAGQPPTPARPSENSEQIMCTPLPHHESLDPEGNLLSCAPNQTPLEPIENASATAKKPATPPQRESKASTTSDQADIIQDRRKTHVGPWQLGKTLGKGSVGRVRLARHANSGELAAVKIISKKTS